MVKKAIHNLLRHRHFWRDIDFTELSEVYICILFRSISIHVTSIFIPFFMLSLGYTVVDIMTVVACYFSARFLFFDIFSGWLTSLIGPKHTIIASYFLLTISTLQFLTLPNVEWPLWLLGALWGGSASMFLIPFHVDFSRIKHKAHGGKELAYVNILEKVGAIFGPVLSGVIGFMFGGQYIFVVAIGLLFIGAWPLLKTVEPIAIGKPLNLGAIRIRRIFRDIVSSSALGIENTLCNVLWPIYLGLFIVSGTTAYAKLGFLASISVVVSLAAAYTIGRLVDTHRGRALLRVGAVLNAALHLFRPFTGSYAVATAVNAANEGLTTSYRLPYIKGMYDEGDSHGAHRVAYFTVMELIGSYSKALIWIILVGLAGFMSDRSVLSLGFAIAAGASLLIMTESFPALKAQKQTSKSA